jgi:glycyl-tRNA synthetase beta chain
VRTLVENRLRASLEDLFQVGVERFHKAVNANPAGFEAWTKARGTGPAAKDADALVSELVDFVITRFKANAEVTADLVDAVVAASPPDPLVLQRKVDALGAIAGRPEFGAVMVTFKRVLNITKGHAFEPPKRSALTHDAERALLDAVEKVEGDVTAAAEALDYPRALDRILVLQQPIAALFDAVMVDAPDPAQKATRIGLLLRVAKSFLAVADFSRISTR